MDSQTEDRLLDTQEKDPDMEERARACGWAAEMAWQSDAEFILHHGREQP